MALRGKNSAGDVGGTAPYRRRSRPVPVRRGLPHWRNLPWRRIALVTSTLAATAALSWSAGSYVSDSERFLLLPGNIAVSGLDKLKQKEVVAVFSPDFGNSLLDARIRQRRAKLLEQPWIRSASVARVWPDKLWVDVVERRPVAYVRSGSRDEGEPRLIDSDGVLLDPIEGAAYSLPVLDGVGQDTPIEDRIPRVHLFEALMRDLDSAQPRYGEHVSEVDVSDTENAKATVLHEGDLIELEMGDQLFRRRYEIFLKYVDGWKRQFGALGRVDLRYEDQVVVLPLAASGRHRR